MKIPSLAKKQTKHNPHLLLHCASLEKNQAQRIKKVKLYQDYSRMNSQLAVFIVSHYKIEMLTHSTTTDLFCAKLKKEFLHKRLCCLL